MHALKLLKLACLFLLAHTCLAGAFKSYMRVERFTKLAVAGHVEWPGRALLDDYAGAVGATRAQYRLLAGTWLNFQSSAGDSSGSDAVCAGSSSNRAVACSRRAPTYPSSARLWPDDCRRRFV